MAYHLCHVTVSEEEELGKEEDSTEERKGKKTTKKEKKAVILTQLTCIDHGCPVSIPILTLLSELSAFVVVCPLMTIAVWTNAH